LAVTGGASDISFPAAATTDANSTLVVGSKRPKNNGGASKRLKD